MIPQFHLHYRWCNFVFHFTAHSKNWNGYWRYFYSLILVDFLLWGYKKVSEEMVANCWFRWQIEDNWVGFIDWYQGQHESFILRRRINISFEIMRTNNVTHIFTICVAVCKCMSTGFCPYCQRQIIAAYLQKSLKLPLFWARTISTLTVIIKKEKLYRPCSNLKYTNCHWILHFPF